MHFPAISSGYGEQGESRAEAVNIRAEAGHRRGRAGEEEAGVHEGRSPPARDQRAQPDREGRELEGCSSECPGQSVVDVEGRAVSGPAPVLPHRRVPRR